MRRELAAVVGDRGESTFELAVTDYSRFALLYNEVVEFWKKHPLKPSTSAFSS